jgi:hypothetical protein
MSNFYKLFLLLFLTFQYQACYSIVRYVKAGNPSSNNGLSWATACGDLQAMINASSSGDDIWVAEGIYKPNSYPAGCTNCSSSRNYTFLLRQGVRLYGGFEGIEKNVYQRNPKINKTYLDGNIGNSASQLDNAYHVVMAIEQTSYGHLEGFYIQNGSANDYSTISISRPLNIPLTIFNSRGGGLYIANCSQPPSLSFNTFTTNFGYIGAGLYGIGNSSTISGNSLIFNNNLGISYGGAISLDESHMAVRSSLFIDNEAGIEGKVGDLFDNAQLEIINCTVYGNSPASSISLFYAEQNSTLHVENSILWDNRNTSSTQIISTVSLSTSTVSKSIIEDGYTPCDSCPNTNGDLNPLFISTSDLDGTDDTFGTDDDGLQLLPCSPAIDYITQTSPVSNDLSDNYRINDYNFDKVQNLDLGAYEKYENDNDFTDLYVNAQLTTGTNAGHDWANAYRGSNALQTALLVAKSIYECGPVVIHLAKGTYKPSVYPSSCTTCSSPEDYTFNLPANVSLVGGYSSDGSTQNSYLYETILDGNVGDPNDSTDNVYHILTTIAKNGRPNIIKDITFKHGGNIDNSSVNVSHIVNGQSIQKNFGGAIYHQNAATELNTCKFENNHAFGGAIYLNNNETEYGNTFNDLSFSNNVGIPYPSPGSYYVPTTSFHSVNSQITLEKIKGFSNRAENPSIISKDFYFDNSKVDILKSLFYENESYEVLLSFSTDLFLQSSVFYNNSKTSIYLNNQLASSKTTLLDHCTVVNTNTSSNIIPVRVYASNVVVANSAIWKTGNSSGNGIEMVSSYSGSPPFVRNSIIYGGWASCYLCPQTDGNIDPKFKNINSLLGTELHNLDDGLRPQITSPLLNNGTLLGGNYSYTDFVGLPKYDDPEIGAYETNPDFCFNWRYYTDKNLPSDSYQAILNIKSESRVMSGNNVTFGAKAIELNPGFEIQPGAIFLADPNLACTHLDNL